MGVVLPLRMPQCYFTRPSLKDKVQMSIRQVLASFPDQFEKTVSLIFQMHLRMRLVQVRYEDLYCEFSKAVMLHVS